MPIIDDETKKVKYIATIKLINCKLHRPSIKNEKKIQLNIEHFIILT